jgi:hypothetical protein
MRHIVSFSTGVPSAITAYLVCKQHPDAIVLFADTKIEDHDNYRFYKDVERLIGKKIVYLTGDKNPYQIANEEGYAYIPNQLTATCTRKAKIEIIKSFMRNGDILYIGMTNSESSNRKLDAPIKNWAKVGVEVKYPLIDMNIDAHALADELGLKKPRMYDMEYTHANCFSGDTKFITKNGAKTFYETVETEVEVLSGNGSWQKSKIKSFGIQDLKKITLSYANETKEIFATGNHRWFIYASPRTSRRKEVITNELKNGDRLIPLIGGKRSGVRLSSYGIAHGIVFGDGTRPKTGQPSRLMLCGDKNRELVKWFGLSPTIDHGEKGIEVWDLPRYFKDLPSLSESKSYLYGWLAGYFAADGTVKKDGECRLQSSKKKDLEYVRDICYVIGVGTRPIRKRMRVGIGNKKTALYTLNIMRHTLSEDFFLIKEHRKRACRNEFGSKRISFWKVEKVEDSNRKEEVYCAVVPKYHYFALEDNIMTGNCGGCCVKQGRKDWLRTLENFPKRYARVERWEDKQRERQATRILVEYIFVLTTCPHLYRSIKFSRMYTLVRRQINKVQVGISLKELREEYQEGKIDSKRAIVLDDIEGYACSTECGVGNEEELEQAFKDDHMAVYKEDCLLCKGKRHVKVPKGKIVCPLCQGTGKVTNLDKERFAEWMMGRKTMWK